jgi:hypothetical protein
MRARYESPLCRLTFELTPTAEAGRLARAVQHKPARRAGKTARRSGSGAERGVRPHCASACARGNSARTHSLPLAPVCSALCTARAVWSD